MNIAHWIARLAGAQDIEAVESTRFAFDAPWVADDAFWLLFLCVAVIGLASAFYARTQKQITSRLRPALAVFRAAALCGLLLLLAEPVLRLQFVRTVSPVLLVLFDGTASMELRDDFSSEQKQSLASATAINTDDDERPSRQDYVRGLLNQPDNLIAKLHGKFRLEPYELSHNGQIRRLLSKEAETGNEFSKSLAAQLTSTGEITPLGDAINELSARGGESRGLLIVGDFGQNAGISPIAGGAASPATRFGGPIHTLGVGAEALVDLAVGITAPPIMRVNEKASLEVVLRGEQLLGKTAVVELRRRAKTVDSEAILIESRPVTLTGETEIVRFDLLPTEIGEFEYSAHVPPLKEETVSENNTARRELFVSDTFLRLFYVTQVPTWEWRFMKEVFHRDELVGLRGFRTYLQSSDPSVRQSNPLFAETLEPSRSDFFANDVIFLEDMPTADLTPRFCEMTKEFVGTFGGGLVVIAGPRYGASGLIGTELEELLPVEPLPVARLRDAAPFRLRRTTRADDFDFMRLSTTAEENAMAWDNLGDLPWYQPVRRVKTQVAEVLAEHPVDTCTDGSPQPIIAIRKYGRGQVVYVAFDEMFRLRQLYGNTYYRRFWGQMIHYLGLKRGSGEQKRFVVGTDRPRYDLEEPVTISVTAFDEEYQPLATDRLPDGQLRATLQNITAGSAAPRRELVLPLEQPDRPGEFVARLNIAEPGEYQVEVRDPIVDQLVETTFRVSQVSLEAVNPTLNVTLMTQLAQQTEGSSARLSEADTMFDKIELSSSNESRYESLPLWNNWLAFGLIVGMLFLEWSVRRWVGAA